LLFWINLMLGLFNLVPALPMDGGRVLRGILALKRDHLSATIIAARVGRVLAVVGVAAALVDGNFTLGLISVFVYLAAGSEVRMAQMRAYQEKMQESPFAKSAGGPFGQGPGRVWSWSWTSGGRPGEVKMKRPHQRPPPSDSQAPNSNEGWSESGIDEDRDVVVVGGKAKVIGRKDPESDD
jgi:hypothetical protein